MYIELDDKKSFQFVRHENMPNSVNQNRKGRLFIPGL